MSTEKEPVKRPLNLRCESTYRANNDAWKKSTLALGLSAAVLGGHNAYAQDDEEITLDTLQIEERTLDTNPYAEPGAPYKAKQSGDERRVKPLAETPQTITVLTQKQIQDSGQNDLREILVAQPGITLGTGENGNAFGDRYIIRGHEARSDVFVDGLRDPGMTTRESFAVEQIEVTKGPSATFAGRGSTGGAINSITKQASTEYHFNEVAAGVGTDAYRRLTLDSNIKLSDTLAVRANLLHGYEEVPDRAPADRERNGLALSLSHQTTEKLKLTGDVYYLKAEDNPDLGTYIIANGDPVDDLPVYSQAQDFLDSDVQSLTFQVDYSINDALRLENKTRYGTTDNGYVVTGARGTSRAEEVEDDEGNIIPGDPDAPGAATVSLSTHQGWQEVEYWVNQTNLFWNIDLGNTEHQWLFSLEYSDLSVLNGVYAVNNNGTSNCVVSGRGGNSPGYCIVDPSGNYIIDNDELMGRQITKGNYDSDFNVETLSVAVMDTVDLNEHWTIHGGIRLDSFDYSNAALGFGATEPTIYDYSDELWNGHLGVVYNINENANVYATYGTSTNINGGESDVGANCGYGGICTDAANVGHPDPETTQNIEVGTKWNILDEKLLLTAAIFQMTKDDVMEGLPRGSSYDPNGTINTGKNRVQGYELSMVGNITDKLSTQFGLTMMDSEILESSNEASIGERLSNFADDSAFLQLRYQFLDTLAIGAIATYSSEIYSGQPDSAASDRFEVPSYTVYDLFAQYTINDQLNVRLNVGNVTDEDYYLAAYRSGSFTYIGDARNAHLTVTYEF